MTDSGNGHIWLGLAQKRGQNNETLAILQHNSSNRRHVANGTFLENWATYIAQAQTTPFLITPYTGNATITQGWSSPFEPNHHAYDFGLNYQPVIAADAGTAVAVQWYSNTCHNYTGTDPNIGLPCGFGLFIRIGHANGYSTYYAHLSALTLGLTTAGTIGQCLYGRNHC